MPTLTQLLWFGGAIQLGMALANFWVPGRLRARENLGRVTPMLRSVFIVHWVYIVYVLLVFSLLTFFFAQELTSGTLLGRFLSGTIAVFWLGRVLIQLLYYDSDLRRQNRLTDVTFTLGALFLGAVFGIAALRAMP